MLLLKFVVDLSQKLFNKSYSHVYCSAVLSIRCGRGANQDFAKERERALTNSEIFSAILSSLWVPY